MKILSNPATCLFGSWIHTTQKRWVCFTSDQACTLHYHISRKYLLLKNIGLPNNCAISVAAVIRKLYCNAYDHHSPLSALSVSSMCHQHPGLLTDLYNGPGLRDHHPDYDLYYQSTSSQLRKLWKISKDAYFFAVSRLQNSYQRYSRVLILGPSDVKQLRQGFLIGGLKDSVALASVLTVRRSEWQCR